jgi:glycosyltransferase involved in cell wall biosynthesis
MKTVSILIPSRLQKFSDGTHEEYFFRMAVASILRQSLVVSGRLRPQILVGIDAGVEAPVDAVRNAGVEFVNSRGTSHAVALNAAAVQIAGDYVAILEDDDQWEPQFFEIALEASQSKAFVSSSQIELDSGGRERRIIDYPTPSSWFMPREIWDAVGDIDESYRWHIDSEWLGRLNAQAFERVHLVEATAPSLDSLRRITLLDTLLRRRKAKQARQGLLRIVAANPNARIFRHQSIRPLVVREFHEASLHTVIEQDVAARSRSDDEKVRLKKRFGEIPW